MVEYEIHLVIATISRVIVTALILGIYNFQSFLLLMIGLYFSADVNQILGSSRRKKIHKTYLMSVNK